MKVFISWSGDLSRQLGEALRDWLPAVIQNVRPFFTPNDIEKGARWGKDIATELEQSRVGIFCLTKENLTKPWIMFEAGALSKNVDISKVCPILFGVDNTDLEGPLVQFQSIPFEKTEIRKLIKQINSSLGDQKLEEPVLNSVFDMWWPKLDEKVRAILEKREQSHNHATKRTDRDILEEILELSRLNSTRLKKPVSRRIHPAVIDHLIDAIENIVDNINEDRSKSVVLESFSGILDPLRQIVHNASFPSIYRFKIGERLELLDSSISRKQNAYDGD